ncbi:MAG: DUF4403 family protein [Gemmatimonadota bacterium]|nr:DUF4403 family protein [Gemmatimonadota bacterium]MDQ8167207.1 DUF4403 family protein [Gemmatimonadota bacterium]MDQ8172004.1 DUF4403 family protein [Gemmatimonadota bacterium]
MIGRTWWRPAWGPLAVAVLAACTTNTAPVTNPTPVSVSAPVSAPTPAPAPATVPVGVAAPAPLGDLAVIPVRVTYVLRALVPSLDSIFPASDSLSAARCAAIGLVCHQYTYRREPLRLRADGPQLFIDAPLAYRARLGTIGGAAGIASCGYAPEAMRRATTAMSTTLYWRRDWKIGARDTKLAATLVDPCTVTALGVNATPTLQSVIDRQLATFAADAERTIPEVGDFRPLADSLWTSFLEPTALDSSNALWLVLDPQAVQVTPFAGNGPSLITTMVLYARPRVIAGVKPAVLRKPLPALTLGTAPADYSVPVSVELPFAELERRAAVLLAADTATGTVRVDSVHVRGVRDSVRIDLTVSGSLRGRLTLTSRLRWDAEARELRLDDLDWSLESRGRLSRVKATLGAPLVGRALRRATNGGRVALGAQLDSVRTELMRLLNGPMAPGVVMGSSVRTVQITDVTATATAFVVRARLTGQSGVWFQ